MSDSDKPEIPRLFVGNIPLNATETEVKEHFEQIGKVSSIFLPINRRTGESKGVAYIEYANESSIHRAIEELHQKEFRGRQLRVSLARSPAEEEADKREKEQRRCQRSRNQQDRNYRRSRDDDRDLRHSHRDRDRDRDDYGRRRRFEDDDNRSYHHHQRNRDRDDFDKNRRDRDHETKGNQFQPPLFYPPPMPGPDYNRQLEMYQLYAKAYENQMKEFSQRSKDDPLKPDQLMFPYSNPLYPGIPPIPPLMGMPMMPGMIPSYPAPLPSSLLIPPDPLASFPPPPASFDSSENDRMPSNKND